jgi:hypothetical protein
LKKLFVVSLALSLMFSMAACDLDNGNVRQNRVNDDAGIFDVNDDDANNRGVNRLNNRGVNDLGPVTPLRDQPLRNDPEFNDLDNNILDADRDDVIFDDEELDPRARNR